MSQTAKPFVLLAFEASAGLAAAAVRTSDGGAWQSLVAGRHGHAGPITGLALDALGQADIGPGDITHVAAGRGPGSFTGIRVAIAAAKGFCIATGAAGLGVSCLAAMAHSVAGAGHGGGAKDSVGAGGIIATADTRRGGCFAQLFSAGPRAVGDIIEIDPASPPALQADWHGAVVTGDGAEAMIGCYPDAGLVARVMAPPLDAAAIARLAARRIAGGERQDPLSPLYVAPPLLGPPAKARPGKPEAGAGR